MMTIICLFFFLFLTVQASERLSSRSQEFGRLRPIATDKMPLPILEEDPDKVYDPSASDIDHDALRYRLGVDFIPSFMSPTRPRNFETSDMVKPLPDRIPSEIRRLFKRRNRRGRSRRQWRKLMKNKRAIKTWLYQETACPVRYRWKDLGIRFWPRYIKEGYCDSSKSCSIPAGMKCKSSSQTKIVILRWYCQGILLKKFCSWINVQYPVISECKCQC